MKKDKEKPSHEQIQKTLERVREGRQHSIPPDEVTGVIDLALQQLVEATDEQHQALLNAVDANEREARKVHSSMPPPGDEDDRKTDPD